MRQNLTRFASISFLAALVVQSALAQVPASQDTIYIPGGTLRGRENAGLMEATINGDTTSTGARINPNRVYALNEGQYYFQVAPINVIDPTGTLAIVGVPSAYGKTKPIILIANTGAAHVVINASATNQVYGSLKFENIYYVTQELDGYQNAELFYCGTTEGRLQSLRINNCLFEFSNIDLFDCTNETGAIGGWPYGAKFFITNSYFRNLFHPSQWWGSRVFQCLHPIDTLWVENCTVTTGGLTFLQRNELTDFEYINHNTFVNNMKCWLTSPYHHYMFITNNIFMNQMWVGEDTNVTNSGQDPDKYYMSTINIDTNNATNGLVVQGKYYAGDSNHISAALGFTHMRVYISDNINYYDPLLTSEYYTNSKYTISIRGQSVLPSYLNWAGAGSGPWAIGNTPGAWMNSRTQALFAAWRPGYGGFLEMRTSPADPQTVTKGIASASVVDSMAVWNQNQWGDPRFPSGAALQNTNYIYGDYDPTTLPGIVNGLKTERDTSDGAGITKFTDLTENFSQATHLSAIDGFPIGALIWDDAKLTSYNSANALAAVWNKYCAEVGCAWSIQQSSLQPSKSALLQNYPNPFNPTTTIQYALPQRAHVTLSVYNLLGQQVAELVNGDVDPGNHEVKFDGSNIASGIYFYRIQAGSLIQTKKLVLLH